MKFHLLLFVLLPLFLHGKNLIYNGSFIRDDTGFISDWEINDAAKKVIEPFRFDNGKNAIRFNADQPLSCIFSPLTKLVPGGKYKVTAWVKTKNYSAKRGGVHIIDNRWAKGEHGFRFPKNTTGWQKIEKTVTIGPADGGYYKLVVWSDTLKGELAVTGVKLEPASEETAVKSIPFKENPAFFRLFVSHPLKDKIPADNPVITLQYTGKIDGLTCEAQISEKKFRHPLDKNGRVKIDLTGFKTGRYHLSCQIKNRDNLLGKFEFPIRIVDIPEFDRSGIKKLNNLTANSFTGNVTSGVPVKFANPKDGWIHLRFEGKEPEKVMIGKLKINLEPRRKGFEGMCFLPRGNHSLTIDSSGKLRINAIAETLFMGADDYAVNKLQNKDRYTLGFRRRYIFDAVNCILAGKELRPGPYGFRPTPEEIHAIRSRQLRWTWDRIFDGPGLDKLIINSTGWNAKDIFDGITLDEAYFGRTEKGLRVVDEVKKVPNPDDRLIYTWNTHGDYGILESYMVAEVINFSGGRGRHLYEAYMHNTKDLKSLHDHIEHGVVNAGRGMIRYIPDVMPSNGIVIGCFAGSPQSSLEAFPNSDIKYMMDYAFNKLANHPVFANLGGVGFYSYANPDEEYIRWAMALLRHYAIEGNTTMLSDKYGFKYLPETIRDGDFNEKDRFWNCSKDVTFGRIKNYGEYSGRYMCNNYNPDADCFAVLPKKHGSCASVSQTVKNLEPGKIYCLRFVVSDFDTDKRYRVQDEQYPATAFIDGAYILEHTVEIHRNTNLERKEKENDRCSGYAMHKVLFRAKKTEHDLTISNAAARNNSTWLLNFVQVNKYFPDETALY